MDPYKVLGIPQSKVTHPSDLGKVRRRAKLLYKRLAKEDKKFDAKKILEAFGMVQANLKNKPGEGAYKILGRSRKERELDKHFNHQTKEIKNNKDIKRTLKRARHGDRRFRLPGDKERVARPHRRRRGKRRTRRQIKNVDALAGLERIAGVLPHQAKFPKAIKLLHRWIKEFMNLENRGYVFKVLQEIACFDFIAENPDARQDVVEVFTYVLGFFSVWFSESDDRSMLASSWRVAAVLACRCFTDDAFMLSATIADLNEALCIAEKHKGQLTAANHGVMVVNNHTESSFRIEEKLRAKEEVGSKWEEKGLIESDMPAPKQKNDEDSKAKVEDGIKEEGKSEAKEEAGVDQCGTRKPGMVRPVASPSPGPLSASSSDEEVDGVESIDDDADDLLIVDEEEDLIDVESEDDVKDEVSSIGSSSCGSSDVEEVEIEVFKVPHLAHSLHKLLEDFVNRCLSTLFKHRAPLWAKPKIDAFFQDVFYRRDIFGPTQQSQMEAWQARIKTLQKFTEREVGEANNPLEAHRPVVDSRETRVSLDADSNAWAAKQTFDSRDRCGGSKIIR